MTKTNVIKHILQMERQQSSGNLIQHITDGTYIDHNDKTLRKNYIKRHLKDLNTNDFTRPGFLSLFISWNKETLKESMRDYNRRIKTITLILKYRLYTIQCLING